MSRTPSLSRARELGGSLIAAVDAEAKACGALFPLEAAAAVVDLIAHLGKFEPSVPDTVHRELNRARKGPLETEAERDARRMLEAVKASTWFTAGVLFATAACTGFVLFLKALA